MFIYSAISSFDFTQDFGQEIKDTQKQLSKQNITVKRLKVRLNKFFFYRMYNCYIDQRAKNCKNLN